MLTKEIAKTLINNARNGGRLSGKSFYTTLEKFDIKENAERIKISSQFDKLCEENGYCTLYQSYTVLDANKIKAMTDEELETLISKIGA